MPAVTSAITNINGPRDISKRHQYLIPKSVKPRIRRAIENMVWQGLDRPAAAASINMSDNGLYKALKNPEALKYYQNECELLRSGQRHRNIHQAMSIRDKSASDNSRVNAMKFLEGDYGDETTKVQVGVSVQVTPGYIIDVSPHAQRAAQILQLSGGDIKDVEDQ